jgi:YebC/PmpR family DNA-binding regulatory protein
MAGHSKWANIKHRKAAQDKKRGKIYSKLIRGVTVAAKKGADLESNPGLRLAVDKARAANMDKDTIKRAISRGAGGDDSANLDEIRYEGYGPCGVAIIVDCLTDNKQRTVAEVRHAFSKHGGNLGTDGCVAYLFQQQGVMVFAPGADEESLMEAALEAGADDVITHDDNSIEVLTAPERFNEVNAKMTEAGFVADTAEVTMNAEVSIVLNDNDSEKYIKLYDRLEDLDDVQEVYSNADVIL